MTLAFQNVPFFPGAVKRILGKMLVVVHPGWDGGKPQTSWFFFHPSVYSPFLKGMDVRDPRDIPTPRSASLVDPWGDFSLQDTDASSHEPSTPGSTPKSGKMPKAHMLQEGPGSREPKKNPKIWFGFLCVDVSPRFQAGFFQVCFCSLLILGVSIGMKAAS